MAEKLLTVREVAHILHISEKDVVEFGDKIRFVYTAFLEDGTVVDQSPENTVFEAHIGTGGLISGLEEGLIGMKKGQKKLIIIPPEKGYGTHNPSLVQEFSLKSTIGNQTKSLSKGDAVYFEEQFIGIVFYINETEDKLLIDSNHPFAGRTLIFDVQVVNIEKPQ